MEKSDATTGWLSSGLNGANSVSFDGEFMFLFILSDTISLYAFWNSVKLSLRYLRSLNYSLFSLILLLLFGSADIDATYVYVNAWKIDTLTDVPIRWSRSLRPLCFVLEIFRCFEILIDGATDIEKDSLISVIHFVFFLLLSCSLLFYGLNVFKEEKSKVCN